MMCLKAPEELDSCPGYRGSERRVERYLEGTFGTNNPH